MLSWICFAAALTEVAANTLADCCTSRSITLEARIPSNATGADIDQGLLPFNPSLDLGQNQTFAEVLQFPAVPSSLYDASQYKAVEVTLNDGSIFTPSATNKQTGFRRTELLPQNDALAANASTSGTQIWHLSVRRDETRQLNYSHEYYLFWQESQDYSRDQYILGTGTLFGDGNNQTTTEEAQQLWLRSNDADSQKTLWKTSFTTGVWHNIALFLDYSENMLQVYYSTDNDEPIAQGGLVANDLTGNGQFHIGLLKKPTGVNLTDITKQGFQESGIDEGVIFGGAFEEACN